MTVTACLRVKNEARWIRRCIESILPICDDLIVFDDHSVDDTPDIARELGAFVIQSEFESLDEVRDKNYLLDRAPIADWVLMIDGDEALASDQARDNLRHAMLTTRASALAFPIWYLWDREDQKRVDGVYRSMSRVSAFRPGAQRFENTTGSANFHCGNCPQGIGRREFVPAPLLHFGYMNREDRIRKYRWYQEHDPANVQEDFYRHVVIGDLFRADSCFRHGGPLELRPL